jgi:hypothetical protein
VLSTCLAPKLIGGTDTIPINWVMLGAPALFQLIWVLGVPGLIILFKDSVWTHLIKILVLGVKKKLKKKKLKNRTMKKNRLNRLKF